MEVILTGSDLTLRVPARVPAVRYADGDDRAIGCDRSYEAILRASLELSVRQRRRSRRCRQVMMNPAAIQDHRVAPVLVGWDSF